MSPRLQDFLLGFSCFEVGCAFALFLLIQMAEPFPSSNLSLLSSCFLTVSPVAFVLGVVFALIPRQTVTVSPTETEP